VNNASGFQSKSEYLGVNVLLMPAKWLLVPLEGVCVNKFVL
jgi:hypothetical protein